MSQTIELINAIVDDNVIDSEQIFNSVMADKIADKLHDYRKEVASTFFDNVTDAQSSEEMDLESDATE
jgi:hypothetical protein